MCCGASSRSSSELCNVLSVRSVSCACECCSCRSNSFCGKRATTRPVSSRARITSVVATSARVAFGSLIAGPGYRVQHPFPHRQLLACPSAPSTAEARQQGEFPGSRGPVMNIFRLAGDMSHLLSILVLLLKIRATKSCRGEVDPDFWGRAGPKLLPHRRAERSPGRSVRVRRRWCRMFPDSHFPLSALQVSRSKPRSCMRLCLSAATSTCSTRSSLCEQQGNC